MKVLGIIPARYNSTRLPGKPLIDLMGKPMIQHVVEQTKKASLLSKVVVATDDERIKTVVTDFGGNAIMTSGEHQTGTSRCAEVMDMIKEDYDYVINIQGDEPLIRPQQIDLFASLFQQKDVKIATLARPLNDQEEIESPNVVKLVMTTNQRALYFSRSIIPYPRNESPQNYLQHIGIYGYKSHILREISQLSRSPLEKKESLEQLRWLEHGYSIAVGITHDPTYAVDTIDDVETVIQKMRENG